MQQFFFFGGGGGRGLNKVHRGHMIMVNSRNYNGNGYKLLAKRFSVIIWVDKRILMLVNGRLEYHRPMITHACPPKQSQTSLHPKLVPILPRGSREKNSK